MKLFKVITGALFTIIVLSVLTVAYDLAYYDPSYLNRPSITFSVNNLNSRKIQKLFFHYDKLYYKLGFAVSKKHKEFWKTEDPSEREKLPKTIKIKAKNGNFSTGTKIENIEKNF